MRNFFILYLVIINVVSLLIMYVDKSRARNNKWRIKENTIFLFSILGGSLGALCGMYLFRHKTKHLKFTLGIPFILIIQIFILLKTMS